ncbi:MAG: DUF2922 family protein [Synergistaceae bacterium]|nr:DUF2922 family protein [Synergistaceae bacterium]
MATTTSNRLVCKFENLEGKALSKSFNYANASATAANVKALMNAIITNGDDVFNDVPTQKTSAQMITTTTTDIDIED